jgi:mono/diheme cytochrome c family protein
MKTALQIAALALVLVLAGLAFLYSGVYDVAASSPDSGPIHWLFETARERSMHRAAEAFEEGARIPDLDDPALVRTGFVHYHAMCVACHGAPGVPLSEIGQGLNPYPPELAAEAAEESPAEIFWVVKNGIKMTGMPAFGVTHGDEEIWAIVAFLKRMPKLSPEEYRDLVRQAGLVGRAGSAAEPGGGGHHHAPGMPPHER